MTNTLEILTKSLTDETFEKGERKRLAMLDKFSERFACLKQGDESSVLKLLERISNSKHYNEFSLDQRMGIIYGISRYYSKTAQTFQLDSLKKQTAGLVDFLKEHYGELRLLFYKPSPIVRLEFQDALKEDWNYIEENADSSDFSKKLRAARCFEAVVPRFYLMLFGIHDIIQTIPKPYFQLTKLWIENINA
jgi:hypothetical protein